MNDPVLPEAGAEGANTVVPAEGATAAPPAPDRFDRLERSMNELRDVVSAAAQAVSRMPAPQALPDEPPERFLERMAADPRGVIQEVARQQYSQTAQTDIGAPVRTMMEAAARQLISTHRSEIDSRFGNGTFDEVFRPQLEKDVNQLLSVNPQAAANPETVQALVDRLYGGANFTTLRERERAMETARSRGVLPGQVVPGGGVPRLRTFTGDELPDDVEQFCRDVERSTGETVDRKAFAKLYHTGRESGPGRHRTTVADYLQAIGADADTKQRYLGEKQS